jgi:hypothetical protein
MVIPSMSGVARDRPSAICAIDPTLSTAGGGIAPFGRSPTQAGVYLGGSSAGIRIFKGAVAAGGRDAGLGLVVEGLIAEPSRKAVLS